MRDETEIKKTLERVRKLYAESDAKPRVEGGKILPYDAQVALLKKTAYITDIAVLEWVLELNSEWKTSWMSWATQLE